MVLANGLIALCALLRAARLAPHLAGRLGLGIGPAAATDALLERAEDVAAIFAAPLLWSCLLFFVA